MANDVRDVFISSNANWCTRTSADQVGRAPAQSLFRPAAVVRIRKSLCERPTQVGEPSRECSQPSCAVAGHGRGLHTWGKALLLDRAVDRAIKHTNGLGRAARLVLLGLHPSLHVLALASESQTIECLCRK